MANSRDNRAVSLIYFFLALTTLGLYWPVLHSDFIYYDDSFFVFRNEHVKAGLTWPGLVWAFTTPTMFNWLPLTWLSFMLDAQFFKLQAGGYHLTNLLLHTADAMLLFRLMRQLTGAMWRSAAVAAFFALHPIHVESVAWVTERKDVLSTLFFLLTLTAYARYVRESKVENPKWKIYYALALLMFAMGLMAKSMLVTLPFVLLLLDYWPLGRFMLATGNVRPRFFELVREKIPFFVLTAVSCRMTIWALRQSQAGQEIEPVPLAAKLANSLVSCVQYIRKMMWPTNLAVFYPYTRASFDWEIPCLILLSVSALVVLFWRQKPYAIVGWCWYLGTLVPASGLVQFGPFCMADRYTYVPSIGLFVIVAWLAGELAARWRYGKMTASIGVALALTGFAAVTALQVRYWKNSETLFKHSIQVAGESYPICNDLANYLAVKGRVAEAIEYYQKAEKINPRAPEVHVNFGFALEHENRLDEAARELGTAALVAPRNAEARLHLARVLARQGKLPEAIEQFQAVLKISPDWPPALKGWADAQARQGKYPEAIDLLTRSLKIDPADMEGEAQLAAILAQVHRAREAAEHYRAALRLRPDTAAILNNLAWLLATCPDAAVRNGTEAVALAKRACELTGNREAVMIGTLAAAYAEAGQFEDAAAAAQKAQATALASGQKEIAEKNGQLLQLYQSRQAYHESP